MEHDAPAPPPTAVAEACSSASPAVARCTATREPLAAPRRLCVLLGLTAAAVYAYFYGGATWNQNARLDAIFALVEPGTRDTGTFHIDRFIVSPTTNTGDWAWHDGHFYMNKAPGTTLLGAPFYWLLSRGQLVLGVDLQDPIVTLINAYLIHLAVTVLPAAAGIFLFCLLLRQRGTTCGTAAAATLLLAFGTSVFPFATVLMGHATALAFVIGAVYCAERATVETGRSGTAPVRLAASGLLAGMAVLTEYLAAVTTVLLFIVLVLRHRRRAAWYVAGGLLPLLVHLTYHGVCFGNPLALATAHSNPDVLMGADGALFHGAFWRPLLELLFLPYRGLLAYSPVLALSVAGFVLWFRRAPRDGLAWLSAGGVLLTLLIVATFTGWHGGASAGPRYLIVSLPFWGLPLVEALRSRWLRAAALPLGVVSVLNMLVIAGVSPIVPEEWQNPLYGRLYGMLLRGEITPWDFPVKLHLDQTPAMARLDAFNWGQLLGLPGAVGVFLAGLVLLLAGLVCWRVCGRAGTA